MWMYLLSLRACASAALKDVSAYFSKEQGQVAVSKRTTETVPLITIKPTESLFSLLYRFLSQVSLKDFVAQSVKTSLNLLLFIYIYLFIFSKQMCVTICRWGGFYKAAKVSWKALLHNANCSL